MKKCTFCGCTTDNKTTHCASCGSKEFVFICPNCSAEYEGLYCPKCGVRRDATAKVCPKCTVKYYTKFCPNCGYNPDVENKVNSSANNTYSGRIYKSKLDSDPGFLSFILALISLVTMLFPFAIVSIVLASNLKKKGQYTPLTRSGFILAIFSLCISGGTLLLYIIAGIFSVISRTR